MQVGEPSAYKEEERKVEHQGMGESGGRELKEKEVPQSINENEQMENWMSKEGERHQNKEPGEL
jgi:hypothetical protein